MSVLPEQWRGTSVRTKSPVWTELVVQYCFIIWVLYWEEPGLTLGHQWQMVISTVRFSCMRESLRVTSEWHYLKSPSTIMFWKWKQGMVAWKSSAKAKKWHNCIISNLSCSKKWHNCIISNFSNCIIKFIPAEPLPFCRSFGWTQTLLQMDTLLFYLKMGM